MRALIIAAVAAVLTTFAAGASGPPAPKPGTSLIKVNFRHRPHPRPPEPVPDDSNTCVPTPPSCTGQWCTSCTDGLCLDIDGPGASASLCDGELSWCSDDDCGAAPFVLRDLSILQGAAGLCEFEAYPGGCRLTCGDVSVGCSLQPHSEHGAGLLEGVDRVVHGRFSSCSSSCAASPRCTSATNSGSAVASAMIAS